MVRYKVFLLVASILGSFLIVYGTAFIGNFTFGNFFMTNGINDLNYGVLAILCAAPFFLYILFSRKKSITQVFKVSLVSSLLFLVVFIPVQLTLAFENPIVTTEHLLAVFTILPGFGLLMIMATHFSYK